MRFRLRSGHRADVCRPCCGQFYHREAGGRNGLARRLRRLPVGQLYHMEVFLGDEVAFHSQPELIAAGSGEDQRGNVDAEV